MDAIVVPTPAQAAEHAAYRTLGAIQRYVYGNYNRFSLPMLASILGRVKDASALQQEILLLVRMGLMSTVGSGVYELSVAGKQYDVPEDPDDGEFHIEFHSREPDPEPPPKPQRRR